MRPMNTGRRSGRRSRPTGTTLPARSAEASTPAVTWWRSPSAAPIPRRPWSSSPAPVTARRPGHRSPSCCRNIYAKLGVTNRRAAVRRGEDLHLLPRHRDHPGRAAVSGR